MLPLDIKFEEKDIRIFWDNEKQSLISFHKLRSECPCAYCEDEFTGKRLITADDISQDIKPLEATRIGAYAMKVLWSDQHSAGIFTWEFLAEKSQFIKD